MARERNPQQIQREPVRGGITIAEDLLGDGGESFIEFSRRGVNAQTTIMVGDLSGTTLVEGLLQALRSRSVPAINSFDPKLVSFVSSLRATYLPKSNTQANVVVNWGPEDATGGGFNNNPDDPDVLPTIQIDVTLQHVRTMFDQAGRLIVIDNYRDGLGLATPQTGEIQMLLPVYSVIATRLERLSPGLVKTPQYSGTMNADFLFGDPKHIWLAAITGRSTDTGETYQVTYTFHRRHPDSWNALVVHRDVKTGRPSVNVTKPRTFVPGATGNGSLIVQVYPDLEWRGAGLDLPDTFWGPSP